MGPYQGQWLCEQPDFSHLGKCYCPKHPAVADDCLLGSKYFKLHNVCVCLCIQTWEAEHNPCSVMLSVDDSSKRMKLGDGSYQIVRNGSTSKWSQSGGSVKGGLCVFVKSFALQRVALIPPPNPLPWCSFFFGWVAEELCFKWNHQTARFCKISHKKMGCYKKWIQIMCWRWWKHISNYCNDCIWKVMDFYINLR